MLRFHWLQCEKPETVETAVSAVMQRCTAGVIVTSLLGVFRFAMDKQVGATCTSGLQEKGRKKITTSETSHNSSVVT